LFHQLAGNPDIVEFVYTHSSSFTDLLPGLCSLLERWLGESLLVSYREASDVSPAITPYFEDPHVKAYLESLQKGSLGLAVGRIFKEAFRLVTRTVGTPMRAAKWAARGLEELAAGLRRNETKGSVTVEETITASLGEREAHEARMEAVRERLWQSGGTAEQLQDSNGFEGAAIGGDVGGRFDGGNGAEASGEPALKRGPPALPPQERPARGVWESGKLKDLDLEQFTKAPPEAHRLQHELEELASGDGQQGINELGVVDLEPVLHSASDGEERFDDVVAMKAAQSGAVSAGPPAQKSSSGRNVMLGAAILVCAVGFAAMKVPRKASPKPPVHPPATARTITPPQPKPQQQTIRKPPVETPPQREADTRMPPMDSVLAEGIIRRWQKAKAGALGKRNDVSGLKDVLDGAMLAEWTGKAREFAARGKRWEYDLVGISVESVRVSNRGREAAVEVTLQVRRPDTQNSKVNREG
jgi:hypothetical protein